MSVRVPSLNTITVSGRLTRDVELKFIGDGKALAKFSIANTEYFTTNGEKRENTTFVDVTCWGKQAEWVSENVTKGSAVIIGGKLKSNSWDDKETGKKRTGFFVEAREVFPLEWNDSEDSNAGGNQNQNTNQRPQQPQGGGYQNRPQTSNAGNRQNRYDNI